jgi:predicted MFS family arabinose efflux permease
VRCFLCDKHCHDSIRGHTRSGNDKEQLEAAKGFRLQDFFEKAAMPVSIVMLFVGMAYASILAFINSYALSLSLIDAAAFFFVIYSAFIFISRLFTGRLLDNIVMYPALLSFALSLVLISKAGDSFTFLLAGAFAGLGFGTIMSCAQVIAVNNSPQHRMGIATSTFFFCMDLGVGAGSFFAGEIISMTGFRDMYMVMAIIVALSILLYYILHGRKTASDKHSAPGCR